MKLKGHEYTTRVVDVELQSGELFKAVMEIFHEKYPVFDDGNYIDERGFWQCQSYPRHQVTGCIDDLAELATFEEIRLNAHRKFLYSLLANH